MHIHAAHSTAPPDQAHAAMAAQQAASARQAANVRKQLVSISLKPSPLDEIVLHESQKDGRKNKRVRTTANADTHDFESRIPAPAGADETDDPTPLTSFWA